MLPRLLNAALWKRNFQRDQIEQHGKAQLIDDWLFSFGKNRELHNASLHCRDPVIQHADRAQAHILRRIESEFSQADTQGKIGDGSRALIGAYFSFELIGALDPRHGDKIVGKNIDATRDRDNVDAAETGAHGLLARKYSHL